MIPPPADAAAGHAVGDAIAQSKATIELGLLEVAPDAIVVADAAGMITLANARAEALSGYSRAELLGRKLEQLLPGGPDWGATFMHRADGTDLPVEITLSQLETHNGYATVAIVRDATERRRIEAELRRSHERLSEAQELARLGSWEWDIPANRVIWSDELYRIYGFEPQSFEPTYEKFLNCVHADDRASVDARNHKAFADHQPFEDVKRIVRPDGSEFLMRTQGEVVTGGDGNPIRMLGVCEDVTDAIRARQAEARLAAIVQSAGDAIYTLDTRGHVTSWNPGAERLFGYSREEMAGRGLDAIERGDQTEHTAHARLVAGAPGVQSEPVECKRRRKDGELVDVSITISTLVDADGSEIGTTAIVRDISEQRKIENRLDYLANHDGLTGLLNRRRFEEELSAALARAGRDRSHGAVLLVDLDNFKYVNDTYGHHTGDALLTGLARAIGRHLKVTDVLARLGGDEFGVLVVPHSLEQAASLAADLVAEVRSYAMEVDGRSVGVTASIGVIAFDGDSAASEVLLADVDRAMYEAKDAGRDRVTIHSIHERATSRARMGTSWDHLIREALEHDRFELFCQPIVHLESGAMTNCEVLLRMRGHDGADHVLPGAFLGTAERSGLIHAIDRWVISNAIESAARHPELKFEINVSGRTTDDDQLAAFIGSQLAKHAADPANVIFELTETAAIGNISRAHDFARELEKLGCKLALDDFGAGFSTFYYLKHLPAHYLKIDGDFVATPRSRTDELVIDSIVRIARDLGKETIAEFVGDEATLARVRELGVDFGQGFYLAKPFPVSQLADVLSAAD